MFADLETVPDRPKAIAHRGSGISQSGGVSATVASLHEIAVPRYRSLAMVLVIFAALFMVGGTVFVIGLVDHHAPIRAGLLYGLIIAAVLASVGMAAITKMPWPATRIVNIGVAYQIVGALLIALLEEGNPERKGLSVVALWILSFTLVPLSPQRATVAVLGAALASPLGFWIHVLAGYREIEPGALSVALLGNLFGGVIALFTNQVIYRLGRQVESAKQLGAYTLTDKLGGGGMGEVWRAQHRALIRPAAIKLIRPELTRQLDEGDAMRTRFEREVQLTALLTSPHTVAIYDFGRTDDDRLYYVMELLHGLDLERVIGRHGPLPAERVIYLLRQVCESLGEAHAAGLVHRDIKPANLYLCTIGGKVDFVKVLDFGLVRDLSSSVRLTGEGLVSGTPAYIAPETAASTLIDARSDIYALACVAYYMLTGKLVFEAQTGAAMMAAHLRDAVVPPSQRTELDVPRGLDELIVQCLAKDPDQRPQSMKELRERLDAIELPRRWDQARAFSWWNAHVPDVVAEASDACKRVQVDRVRAAGVLHHKTHE